MTATICDGESYFVGGDFQTESGIYYDTLSGTNGCDSIVETTLTVLPILSGSIAAEICQGENYFAGGAFQTQSGIYYDTLTSSNGCDSILETTLTVNPVFIQGMFVEICDGESYFAGGAFQTESGVYNDTLTSSLGCDSIIQTNLSVLPAPVTNAAAQICQGDSLFVGGAFQTQSGVYTDTFSTDQGCDSIVETTLSVIAPFTENISASICDGESYFAGGAFQTTSGTYFDSLTSTAGCDSIVITELTVNPVYQLLQQIQICDGDSFFAGGAFQTESGTYTDSFITQAGCDSIVVTELTVQQVVLTVQNPTICEGDSFFAGGTFQTQSGIYFDTTAASGGCDSITVTNLTVLLPAFTSVDVTICEGDSVFAGGAFQTDDGVYLDTFAGSNGCDSIVVTELFVSRITIITQSVDDARCFGSTDGAITISLESGEEPYVLLWSNGVVQQNVDGSTDVSITGLGDGTYSVTATDNSGCEEVATFTVNEPVEFMLGIETTPISCNGGSDGAIDLTVSGGTSPYSYLWSNGDTTQDIGNRPAGFDTVVVTDANGCMTLVVIQMLEPDPIPTTIIIAEICEGDSVLAGGDYQTESGSYFDTLASATGCDSIIVTLLTVIPSSVTNMAVAICEGESYFAGGAFQTVSGTYYDTLEAANGCDSLIVTGLTVNPVANTIVPVEICQGQSYFAGGAFQTASGTYYDTLSSMAGCDSIVVTELTVAQVISSNVTATICEGDSIFAGGAFRTEAGTYYDTLQAAGGCDSVVATVLIVNPAKTTGIEYLICDGDSIFIGGAYRTETGTYYDTLQTAAGCDSILAWDLFVMPSSDTTVFVSICDGEFYFVGGGFQNQSGTYYDNFTTAFGCDSLVTTILTVHPNKQTGIEYLICEGDSFFVGGGYQTTSGTYYDTLQTSAGCDSILAWDLFVIPSDITIVPVTICEGDSFLAGGAYQTQSGTYFDTLSNSLGCDSIIVTNLSVITNSSEFVVVNICPGDSLFVGGAYQTQSGEYVDTLVSASGCDSIRTTQLNILPQMALSGLASPLSCNGVPDGAIDLFVIGGTQPYSFSWSPSGDIIEDPNGLFAGLHTVVVTDSNGCQATNITLVTQPDSISVIGNITNDSGAGDGSISLVVSGGTAPYTFLWSTGDTTQDLTGLVADTYEVTITDANGCSITAAFDVFLSPFRRSGPELQMHVYPNPFRDIMILEVDSKLPGKGWITLTDLLGKRVIFQQVAINAGINKYELKVDERIADAVYLLEVVKADGNHRAVKAVMKE